MSIVQYNDNSSWVAGLSGAAGSLLFAVVDGLSIPILFSIPVIDLILKAAQTAVVAGVGATTGLIVKEVYPHVRRWMKSRFKKNKFNNKRK